MTSNQTYTKQNLMNTKEFEVTIESLNERGYGVATHPEKGQVLILNALPGEKIIARPFKKKKGKLLATAVDFKTKSEHRVEQKDDHFTSSSPWQIMTLDYESTIKKELIHRAFEEQNLQLPEFDVVPEFKNADDSWHYRNKVEFSLYADEDEKVTIAFHKRDGGYGKFPIYKGSSIAAEQINKTAYKIVDFINKKQWRAKQLKGLLVRYSHTTKTCVACLYAKDEELKVNQKEIEQLVDNSLVGLMVVHSTAKSPAYVLTNSLAEHGDKNLYDTVLNTRIDYSYDGFFQVNIPVFEQTMQDLVDNLCKTIEKSDKKDIKLFDLYAGVGTIGLVLAKNIPDIKHVFGIEIFPGTREKALKNAEQNGIKNYEFIESAAEHALEHLKDVDILVIDPPRAGLHQDVVDKIKEIKPKTLVYLSCNYKTQAENMTQLQELYELDFYQAYNYYPHTPHVETLGVWKLRR